MAPEQKITCAGEVAVIRPTQLKLQHVLDIFMNLVTRVVREVRGQAFRNRNVM